MVILRVKLKGRKTYNQYHPTIKSALQTKQFIGRGQGKVEILTRGKVYRKKSKPRTSTGWYNGFS